MYETNQIRNAETIAAEPILPRSEGLLFDHYQVERTLGRGAMGVVYLARDLRIGRKVAIKTLLRGSQTFESSQAEAEFLERFRREAELCGSLIHSNIITLYEVGWEGKRISYLAMEYVEGESLLSLLTRVGKLDLEPALKIVDDILQGLTYAHGRNVVHRDIKPANVLISVAGEAKLADFGVARYVRTANNTLTDAGKLIGTPYYMSPELISGRSVDGQSDLFSIGVMLYEMLTAAKPFEGNDLMDVLYNVVNAPPPDIQFVRPDLPRWVGGYLRRLLAKNPSDRFLSAAAASRELRRLLGVHQIAANPLLALGRRIPVISNLSPEDTPTTPIMLDESARLFLQRMKRTVRTSTGVVVILGLLVAFGGTVVLMQREVEAQEFAAAAAAPPAELMARAALMREARILLAAGKYEESLGLYRDYLSRYPWSDAARTGEREALAALEQGRQDSLQEVAEKERRWRELQQTRERQRRAGSS